MKSARFHPARLWLALALRLRSGGRKYAVKLAELLAVLLVFALPLLDVALIVRVVYTTSVPDLLSPFWAISLGLILGVIALVVCVFGQGNTVLEIIIPALILLGLILMMQPVAEQAARQRRSRAIKSKQSMLLQTRDKCPATRATEKPSNSA